MNVSIIIPSFNNRTLLEKNLTSVLTATKNAEVIVVDDASTDKTVSFIQKEFPQVVLIAKKTNTGFADTVNQGVMRAKGEIVVLLNTDTLPQKDFLAPLIAHFKNQNVCAVGCMDESVEASGMIKRGRGIGRFQRGFLIHKRGEINKTNTLWVNGGSGAFRKKIWEQLGGMDTLYRPFYWEDIDFSYRALKMGYTILFEPKSKVEHYHEEGSIKKHFSEFFIKKVSYRNQILFVWKNITDKNLLLEHIMWLPYHKITALLRIDVAFFAGFISALLQLPQVLKKRSQLSVLWKKTDREVLQSFYEEMA